MKYRILKRSENEYMIQYKGFFRWINIGAETSMNYAENNLKLLQTRLP